MVLRARVDESDVFLECEMACLPIPAHRIHGGVVRTRYNDCNRC